MRERRGSNHTRSPYQSGLPESYVHKIKNKLAQWTTALFVKHVLQGSTIVRFYFTKPSVWYYQTTLYKALRRLKARQCKARITNIQQHCTHVYHSCTVFFRIWSLNSMLLVRGEPPEKGQKLVFLFPPRRDFPNLAIFVYLRHKKIQQSGSRADVWLYIYYSNHSIYIALYIHYPSSNRNILLCTSTTQVVIVAYCFVYLLHWGNHSRPSSNHRFPQTFWVE